MHAKLIYTLVALALLAALIAVGVWGCKKRGWFNCKESYVDPLYTQNREYPIPGGYGDEHLGDNIFADYPVAYSTVL